MQRCASTPTLELLWKAYTDFGPCPRVVYRSWNRARECGQKIASAARGCPSLRDLFLETSWTAGISAGLVFVAPKETPDGVERGVMVRRIPTPHISRLLHRHAHTLIGRITQRAFDGIAAEDSSADVARWLWAAACQRRFRRHCADRAWARAFALVPLRASGGPASPGATMSLYGRSHVSFGCLDEIRSHLRHVEHCYFRPFSVACPGIDALAVVDGRLVFFQFLWVGCRPTVDGKAMSVIDAALRPFWRGEGARPRLVFVVPPPMMCDLGRLIQQGEWDRGLDLFAMEFSDEEVWPS
jgi:hypothetical protein